MRLKLEKVLPVDTVELDDAALEAPNDRSFAAPLSDVNAPPLCALQSRRPVSRYTPSTMRMSRSAPPASAVSAS